jgi:hypothetical protein
LAGDRAAIAREQFARDRRSPVSLNARAISIDAAIPMRSLRRSDHAVAAEIVDAVAKKARSSSG